MNTSQILDVINNAIQRWTGKMTEGALPLQELAAELKERFDNTYVGDLYRTTFIVEGSEEFPYDMLRYTNSWPADETAVHAIDYQRDLPPETRRVRLAKYHRDPTPELSEARWISKFHWKVVEVVETVAL